MLTLTADLPENEFLEQQFLQDSNCYHEEISDLRAPLQILL
jgi:hypothetical protein